MPDNIFPCVIEFVIVNAEKLVFRIIKINISSLKFCNNFKYICCLINRSFVFARTLYINIINRYVLKVINPYKFRVR